MPADVPAGGDTSDLGELRERLRKAEERASHLQEDLEAMLLAATEEEEQKHAAQEEARAANEGLRQSTQLLEALQQENARLREAAGDPAGDEGRPPAAAGRPPDAVSELTQRLRSQEEEAERASARYERRLKEAEAARLKAVEGQAAAVEECRASQVRDAAELRAEVGRLKAQLEDARRQGPPAAAAVPFAGAPDGAAGLPDGADLLARFDAVSSAHRLATTQLVQIESSLRRKQDLLDEKTRRCAQLEAALAEQGAQLSAVREQLTETAAAVNELRAGAYAAATAASRDKELLAAEVIRRESLEAFVSTVRGELDIIRAQLQAERRRGVQEFETEGGTGDLDPRQIAEKILARMDTTHGGGNAGNDTRKSAQAAAAAAAENRRLTIETSVADLDDRLRNAAPSAPAPYRQSLRDDVSAGGAAAKT